ncbi:transposase, partial [Aerosakkonemataceae cyanobacterium BLCC-F46]
PPHPHITIITLFICTYLINILPPASSVSIPTRYESQFRGLQARQDYRVINLWEVDAELVFQQPLPSLIPFVPILQGGGNESKVRQALQVLRTDEQLNDLESLLAFFASFVLETPLVQQIMRWDMAVLRESPWYQEILQKGVEQGLQLGREQTLRQGLFSTIALGLELKFGTEGLQLMPEIEQIEDVATLEAIVQGIKTLNTLDELRQIYR